MIAIDLKTFNKCFRARITLRKNRDKIKKLNLGEFIMTEAQKCGCGRSPVENCIGWHALSEEEYKKKKLAYEERQAQKLK